VLVLQVLGFDGFNQRIGATLIKELSNL